MSDVMEDIEKAFSEVEDAESSEAEEIQSSSEPNPEPEGQDEGVSDEPVDESGVRGEEEETEGQLLEPPKGLSPEAREAWKDAPEAIRKDIQNWEKRQNDLAAKFSEDAKRAQAMDATLQPFNQFFQQNGGAQNVLPGLLQTGMALQYSSPEDRAQLFANLLQQFPADIERLDALLSQGRPEPKFDPSQIQQMIDQRLGQFQNQQYEQSANQTLQQFASDPKNEFFQDVKGEMANIIDAAVANGREMPLEEAYKIAVNMRDDIQQVIRSRQSQQQIQQRAPAAALVTGTPGGEQSPDIPGDSILAHLEANFPKDTGRL